MLQDDHRKLIKKAREEYKKIGYVECPALNDEKIYFTNKGFNHLIFRDGKFRSKKDQLRRLSLIKDSIDIIINSKEYNKDRGEDFWSLSQKINNRLVTVVIFKLPSSDKKIFLSVFDK